VQPSYFTKFAFRIRTRDGLSVDNLLISGKDLPDAERKLRQIYHNCEILECTECIGQSTGIMGGAGATNYEDVLGLISRSPV
jgi:hypothetical protein